ncbi:MAG: site-specific integrase [Thermoanaerobaculia bacterium]
MTTTTALAATDHRLILTAETADRARQLIEDGTPENTRRARRGALRYFWSWAAESLDVTESYPVPADVFVRFITEHLTGLPADVDAALVAAGVKAKPGPHSVATVEARVSHLAAAHKALGLDSPTADPRVVALLTAARKHRGRNGGQTRKAAAALDTLNALLSTCGEDLAGIRDRALLLVGFAAGGRRRSELVGATVEDLTRTNGDYVLTVRHSKADQEGHGLEVPVAGRAAVALRRWLEAAEITAGRIFRSISRHGGIGSKLSGRAVALIVKRRAELAGFEAADFAGHSLRAGFITEAAGRGIPLPEVMALSGHKTVDVARRYYRAGAALHNQAARLAG